MVKWGLKVYTSFDPWIYHNKVWIRSGLRFPKAESLRVYIRQNSEPLVYLLIILSCS